MSANPDTSERELDPEEIEQEEDEAQFDSSSQASSTQTSTLTWITWFTSLPGHDYFCEVHEDFIEDDFNLTGLQSMVPFWKEALEMVLDVEPEEDSAKIPDVSIVESSAELLYGLVHQRFILTKAGLSAMVEKYESGQFGGCPRVFCQATPVLPCGRADMPGLDTVKLFCPNCGDIYAPPSSKYNAVDGAFFGTTFAPLFFQTYPELLSVPFAPPPPQPAETISPTPPGTGTGSATGLGNSNGGGTGASSSSTPKSFLIPGGETITNPNPYGGQRPALSKVYTPKIYGFKVSERARSGPRMKWLRERPSDVGELDRVDRRGRWIEASSSASASGLGVGDGGGGGEEVITEREKGDGKGRLFDDDDDVEDEEEEEEEEDMATAGASTTAVSAISTQGRTVSTSAGGGARR